MKDRLEPVAIDVVTSKETIHDEGEQPDGLNEGDKKLIRVEQKQEEEKPPKGVHERRKEHEEKEPKDKVSIDT